MAENKHAVSLSLLPAVWRTRIEALLRPEESVRACFETDLTPDLRYADGLAVLTTIRILHLTQDEQTREWGLVDALMLRQTDYAGVGQLDIVLGEKRLDLLRFTLARAVAATHFAPSAIARSIPPLACARCVPANLPLPLRPEHCSDSGALRGPTVCNCSVVSFLC